MRIAEELCYLSIGKQVNLAGEILYEFERKYLFGLRSYFTYRYRYVILWFGRQGVTIKVIQLTYTTRRIKSTCCVSMPI